MNLPDNWASKKLREIFDTTSGGTPKRNNPKYYKGNIPWLKSGELRDNLISTADEFITTEAINNSSAKIFPKGTLLIALYGATVGRLGILNLDAATNQAICAIFIHKEFSIKYFFYHLFYKRKELLDNRIGGAQPNISQGILGEIIIQVPPVNEQHRIVEKIEELFTKLDTSVTELKNVKKQLKRYRQSVLKSAFEGKLTDIENDDWRIVRLKDISEITSSKRIYKKEYVPEGIPFYRIKEIVELNNGQDISAELFITKTRYNEIKKTFSVPQIGDILITAVGTIGITYLIRNLSPFYFKDGNILWLKEIKDANPQFVEYALINFIENRVKVSGSAYNALTIIKLKEMQIPITSTKSQQKIVEEIETRLSVADKIEEEIDKNLKRTEQLRQSILKKAFEGKLVPQDPNDEPAEKLLERIKKKKVNKD